MAEAGFSDTVPLSDFTFNNSLILALVERWYPEMHTFHLLWGEVVRHGDVGYGRADAWCQATGGGTAGCAEEGVLYAEARVAAGSCPPDALDRRPGAPPTARQVLYYVTYQSVSDDKQVQQLGAHTVATASPGLRGV
ncbi:hypothetical protein Ahy_B05g075942 [Arachis hypogaea]|uniref:Aminotransferase-like plant mobile domain-containing protein n=1 Tax=Arachis hypogaea TaxID=3818 RepID=A0A444Z2C5_ARAHY|nr:hypothetical protein Ahy_B05g075942 [Arachis hypogaea]